MPHLGISQADEVQSSDRAEEAFRSGRGAEVLLSRGHGKWYEAAARGRLFSAARHARVGVVDPLVPSVGSNTAGYGLFNPTDSKSYVVPVRWEVGVTQNNGPQVGFLGLYSSPIEIQLTYETPVAFVMSLYRLPIGASFTLEHLGNDTNAVAVSNPNLGGSPSSYTLVKVLTLQGYGGAATTRPYAEQHSADFDGAYVIPPGGCLYLWQTVSSNNTCRAVSTITWAEVSI